MPLAGHARLRAQSTGWLSHQRGVGGGLRISAVPVAWEGVVSFPWNPGRCAVMMGRI
jgi:hypothetical protein